MRSGRIGSGVLVFLIVCLASVPFVGWAKGRHPVAPLLMRGTIENMQLGQDVRGPNISFFFTGQFSKDTEADGQWKLSAEVSKIPIRVVRTFFKGRQGEGFWFTTTALGEKDRAFQCIDKTKDFSIELWAPVVYIDQSGITRLEADDAFLAGCEL